MPGEMKNTPERDAAKLFTECTNAVKRIATAKKCIAKWRARLAEAESEAEDARAKFDDAWSAIKETE